jgi:hypothetical protein
MGCCTIVEDTMDHSAASDSLLLTLCRIDVEDAPGNLL